MDFKKGKEKIIKKIFTLTSQILFRFKTINKFQGIHEFIVYLYI